jgi:hypothetical protein
MARHLPNQRTRFLSRLDRLEAHLGKDSRFDSQLKTEFPAFWLPFVKEDTPIILDLSDIAKPFAKKMDYLATVRDGSTGQSLYYWNRSVMKNRAVRDRTRSSWRLFIKSLN